VSGSVLVDNGTLTDYSVKTLDIGSAKVQFFTPEVFSVRMDEGSTYVYIGHAIPGASTADDVWRIQRLTVASNAIVFADGNSNFDNIWDNRASLSYS
jgi:hypothetical protein